jgi:hypothetical protein
MAAPLQVAGCRLQVWDRQGGWQNGLEYLFSGEKVIRVMTHDKRYGYKGLSVHDYGFLKSCHQFSSHDRSQRHDWQHEFEPWFGFGQFPNPSAHATPAPAVATDDEDLEFAARIGANSDAWLRAGRRGS